MSSISRFTTSAHFTVHSLIVSIHQVGTQTEHSLTLVIETAAQVLSCAPQLRQAAGVHVVLLEPEIPPNTGNVARLCAATDSTLHLIEPLGFQLDDKQLKRAGMDYWQQVDWRQWPNWTAFRRQLPATARLWLIESGGPKHYAEVSFAKDDYLVFGRETAGLPKALLDEFRDSWLRIPMFNPESRSLNLSNCVALVLFEALRQLGFPDER